MIANEHKKTHVLRPLPSSVASTAAPCAKRSSAVEQRPTMAVTCSGVRPGFPIQQGNVVSKPWETADKIKHLDLPSPI